MPVHTAAWSRQAATTFPDTMALVRRWLWGHAHFSMSHAQAVVVNIPRARLNLWTEALCDAAYMHKVELRAYPTPPHPQLGKQDQGYPHNRPLHWSNRGRSLAINREAY